MAKTTVRNCLEEGRDRSHTEQAQIVDLARAESTRNDGNGVGGPSTSSDNGPTVSPRAVLGLSFRGLATNRAKWETLPLLSA